VKNKIYILMLIILVVLSTGCKKKIEEKIAEKIIEGTTGGKVDISSGTTVMKSETVGFSYSDGEGFLQYSKLND